MSSDTEHQQVVVALMDETEKPKSEEAKQKSKTLCPKKNGCTQDRIVPYAVPIIIIILVILLIILVIIGFRKYNKNCSHTKGTSCRGIAWYFT